VLDWSGYEAPAMWADFKLRYPDTPVDFTLFDSDSDLLTKVEAAEQADLIHPCAGWLEQYVEQGLMAEIDTTKLKNWKHVPEKFKLAGQVNGKQYFVPWDWGFSSLLYRTDKIPEGITSWSALMDPRYKGHIAMWDDGPTAGMVASAIHSYDFQKITPEQLSLIQQEWVAQSQLVHSYWVNEPDLMATLVSGDVWLAYAWQGAYGQLLEQDIPVAYADLREGRLSWICFYGILQGSPHYELALQFLDAKLGLLTGQNLVSQYYYGHASQQVMQGITDQTLKQVFSLDDPSILDTSTLSPQVSRAQRQAWTALWDEVKRGAVPSRP
jgi:spermidine/putrescine transport system substrate-binding protein